VILLLKDMMSSVVNSTYLLLFWSKNINSSLRMSRSSPALREIDAISFWEMAKKYPRN